MHNYFLEKNGVTDLSQNNCHKKFCNRMVCDSFNLVGWLIGYNAGVKLMITILKVTSGTSCLKN